MAEPCQYYVPADDLDVLATQSSAPMTSSPATDRGRHGERATSRPTAAQPASEPARMAVQMNVSREPRAGGGAETSKGLATSGVWTTRAAPPVPHRARRRTERPITSLREDKRPGVARSPAKSVPSRRPCIGCWSIAASSTWRGRTDPPVPQAAATNTPRPEPCCMSTSGSSAGSAPVSVGASMAATARATTPAGRNGGQISAGVDTVSSARFGSSATTTDRAVARHGAVGAARNPAPQRTPAPLC